MHYRCRAEESTRLSMHIWEVGVLPAHLKRAVWYRQEHFQSAVWSLGMETEEIHCGSFPRAGL